MAFQPAERKLNLTHRPKLEGVTIMVSKTSAPTLNIGQNVQLKMGVTFGSRCDLLIGIGEDAGMMALRFHPAGRLKLFSHNKSGRAASASLGAGFENAPHTASTPTGYSIQGNLLVFSVPNALRPRIRFPETNPEIVAA